MAVAAVHGRAVLQVLAATGALATLTPRCRTSVGRQSVLKVRLMADS